MIEKKIKTLIVDDEPLARRRIIRLLEAHPQIEIGGECANGEEALESIKTQHLDLFVTNWQGQANFLYENNGAPDYGFAKISPGVIVNDLGDSFGACWSDYDNDGDLDLFVANRGGTNNYLYRNEGNANHWVNIVCKGIASNAAAIGAKIRLKATIGGRGVWQLRVISGQMGYNSQNSLRPLSD